MEFKVIAKNEEFEISLKTVRSSKILNIFADELKEQPAVLNTEESVIRGIKEKISDFYECENIKTEPLDDTAKKLVRKIASENARTVMLENREMDKN